jgi:GntR family transcriptional regulator
MIDKKSIVPLYYQLAGFLKEQIQNGEIARGVPLPSENALMELYGLSRGTVRQALQMLTQEKLIERFPGRGSFIAEARLEHDANRAIGFFSQLAREAGRRPSARVVIREMFSASSQIAGKLQIQQGEPVLYLQRLRFVDDEPWAIESTYYSNPVAGQLREEDLSTSLYALIQEKYHHRISHSVNNISAALADEIINDHLGIAIGDPVLDVTRLVYLDTGLPFEYSEDIYRADRISLKMSNSYIAESSALNLKMNTIASEGK